MKLTIAVLRHLDDVAGEQRPRAGAGGPVQDGAAGEVAAAADQREPRRQLVGLALPEHDGRVGPHDPLAVAAWR